MTKTFDASALRRAWRWYGIDAFYRSRNPVRDHLYRRHVYFAILERVSVMDRGIRRRLSQAVQAREEA